MCHVLLGPGGILAANGLVISPKSRLQPCQQVLWLGKHFDLLHRVVRNTPALLGRLVALAVLSGLSPVHPKSALRLAGHALWAFRPHRGATLFLRGWYTWQLPGRRFLHRPSRGMLCGLADLCALAACPWACRPALCAPGCGRFIACDAAEVDAGYQVGLCGPLVGIRLVRAPPWVQSQQQAELFGFDCATRLAARLGWDHLHLLGDNSGSLYLLESFRPTLRVGPIVSTCRRLFNRLVHCGLQVFLVWVPTALMPADHPSRFSLTPGCHLPDLVTRVLSSWDLMTRQSDCLRHFGHAWF